MSVKSWMVRTAAFYALRRLFHNTSPDELQKWSDEIGEGAFRVASWYARRRGNAILRQVGLTQRRSSAEAAALLLGGVGAGVALGMGGILMASEEGRALVQRVAERIGEEIEEGLAKVDGSLS